MLGTSLIQVAMLLALQSVTIIGDFTYVETSDPMDDTLRIGAYVESGKTNLLVGCSHSRARTIYVRLKTQRSLAFGQTGLLAQMMPFAYRVDQTPAVNEFVTYGMDTVILEGAPARAMAERLAAGSKISVQVAGLSTDITTTFNTAGAKEAVQKVADRCGDKRLLGRLARAEAK